MDQDRDAEKPNAEPVMVGIRQVKRLPHSYKDYTEKQEDRKKQPAGVAMLHPSQIAGIVTGLLLQAVMLALVIGCGAKKLKLTKQWHLMETPPLDPPVVSKQKLIFRLLGQMLTLLPCFILTKCLVVVIAAGGILSWFRPDNPDYCQTLYVGLAVTMSLPVYLLLQLLIFNMSLTIEEKRYGLKSQPVLALLVFPLLAFWLAKLVIDSVLLIRAGIDFRSPEEWRKRTVYFDELFINLQTKLPTVPTIALIHGLAFGIIIQWAITLQAFFTCPSLFSPQSFVQLVAGTTMSVPLLTLIGMTIGISNRKAPSEYFEQKLATDSRLD